MYLENKKKKKVPNWKEKKRKQMFGRSEKRTGNLKKNRNMGIARKKTDAGIVREQKRKRKLHGYGYGAAF